MQKMMRTMDPQKNIKIMFDDCQKFIGMRIEKTRTSAICIGTEDYIRTDGIVSKVLVWSVTLNATGESIIRKTATEFRVSDIPSGEKAFKNEKRSES